MIPVARAPEPDDFDELVRAKGANWLHKTRARPQNRNPPSYWLACEAQLRRVFASRCGWAAVFVTSGQVEHFVSIARCLKPHGDPQLIYEWANYRYVMPELNSSKKNRAELLDPYDVQPGWFRLSLPSLELQVSTDIPAEFEHRLANTLEQLKLDRHPKLVRLREEWLGMYRRGEIECAGVQRFDPMLAQALVDLFETSEENLPAFSLHYRRALERDRQAAGRTCP